MPFVGLRLVWARSCSDEGLSDQLLPRLLCCSCVRRQEPRALLAPFPPGHLPPLLSSTRDRGRWRCRVAGAMIHFPLSRLDGSGHPSLPVTHVYSMVHRACSMREHHQPRHGLDQSDARRPVTGRATPSGLPKTSAGVSRDALVYIVGARVVVTIVVGRIFRPRPCPGWYFLSVPSRLVIAIPAFSRRRFIDLTDSVCRLQEAASSFLGRTLSLLGGRAGSSLIGGACACGVHAFVVCRRGLLAPPFPYPVAPLPGPTTPTGNPEREARR